MEALEQFYFYFHENLCDKNEYNPYLTQGKIGFKS